MSFETRDCIVNNQFCIFHCWEQWSDVVAPSPMIGGHPGGQMSMIYGIVEFPDGSVKRISPTNIKFCDEKHADLYTANDCFQRKVERRTELNTQIEAIDTKITYLDFYIDAINSKLKDMSKVESEVSEK